jgi:hypothetical protein
LTLKSILDNIALNLLAEWMLHSSFILILDRYNVNRHKDFQIKKAVSGLLVNKKNNQLLHSFFGFTGLSEDPASLF